MSLADSAPVASTQHAVSDITRPCVNFAPSIWGNIFLQYSSESTGVNDDMKHQVRMLQEEVKKLFLSSINHNISQQLHFIDSVQRLGISYHFEREIDEALEQIHNTTTNNNVITEDGDLHFLALLFRLLRQQGYHISSDVFKKFKNNNGNFNEKLANDVQGLWSLYEAAQLSVHGDDILDEASDFTYNHLKSLTNKLDPSFVVQINHCLRQPLRKGVPREEARYYMTFYEEDPSHNKVLLTFAKLDFNILQKLHQKEVGSITKWWKKSDFVTRVPYARDRVVEAYLWPLAMSYEPEFSTVRRVVGKLVAVISLLDDTYDAYGTVEELELFTEAIKSWDIRPIESLPECMKVVFDTILKLFNEIELVTAEVGKSSLVLQHVKPAFCNLAQAYLAEAKWCHEGYIPTYDEYMVNGVISSTCPLQITSFLGVGNFASKEVYDWISSDPKIIQAVSFVGRVMDDMGSHKFEQQRVHVASAVECCMNQYGISQEEAYKLIHEDIKNCWKVINEECLKPQDIPKPVLDCILNLARITELTYKNFDDKYTNGELLKDYVVGLLLDPISIKQNEQESPVATSKQV